MLYEVITVPDRPSVAAQILGPISDANIDVDMIVQSYNFV